jgi:hypothetical protein
MESIVNDCNHIFEKSDKSEENNQPQEKKVSEIPKHTLYLGLLVKEPIEKVYEILKSSLTIILDSYPNISDASNLLKQLEEKTFENEENYKNPWRYSKDSKEWHITTLFKKGAAFKKSHPAYLNFEEGKKLTAEIRGIVYIPNKIIFSLIYVDTPVENEYPHMTTLLGSSYKAKNSNDVCKELFLSDRELAKEYKKMMKENIEENTEQFVLKQEVKILDKKETVYFLKLESPFLIETEMNSFRN